MTVLIITQLFPCDFLSILKLAFYHELVIVTVTGNTTLKRNMLNKWLNRFNNVVYKVYAGSGEIRENVYEGQRLIESVKFIPDNLDPVYANTYDTVYVYGLPLITWSKLNVNKIYSIKYTGLKNEAIWPWIDCISSVCEMMEYSKYNKIPLHFYTISKINLGTDITFFNKLHYLNFKGNENAKWLIKCMQNHDYFLIKNNLYRDAWAYNGNNMTISSFYMDEDSEYELVGFYPFTIRENGYVLNVRDGDIKIHKKNINKNTLHDFLRFING